MLNQFLLCLLLLCSLAGCGYPNHIDPPLHTEPLPNMTFLAAQARAHDLGGIVYHVANTHSMEPLLQGDDYVVVDLAANHPYATLKAGQVITYHADWYPAAPVTHRLVKQDQYGWVLSGDNNANSESGWRVTEKTYIGVVDSIYRTKP